ncbi:MAG TPA: DUF6597 domain-containing transcriptional factor, partial [Kofleriaceae bacterium]
MPRAPAPGEVPYTEIAPPPDLAPYVDRLWLRTTVGGAGRIHRVLPDGCVDIIVDAARGAAQLVGTMTRAIEVADGPSQIIAVRFRPGTAGALVGAPLAELTDRATGLADLGVAGDLVGDLVGPICDPAATAVARSADAASIAAASRAAEAAGSIAAANSVANIAAANIAAPLARPPLARLSARVPIAAADHARVAVLVAWLRARLAAMRRA